MTDALAELEAWGRKYYTAKIVDGPHVQPGDEGYVELRARSGRKVVVDVYDCPGRDEDGTPTAGIADMVREALRRWDADPAPKRFEVMVRTATPVDPAPAGCERWASDTYFRATVTAANDDEAEAAAVALFPPGCGAEAIGRKGTWEVGV